VTEKYSANYYSLKPDYETILQNHQVNITEVMTRNIVHKINLLAVDIAVKDLLSSKNPNDNPGFYVEEIAKTKTPVSYYMQ
jgi:hypothetical protein